jgi:hypothetical protein
LRFKASLGKKFAGQLKTVGMVAHICHPSYKGSVYRRITFQAGLDKNTNPT